MEGVKREAISHSASWLATQSKVSRFFRNPFSRKQKEEAYSAGDAQELLVELFEQYFPRQQREASASA